VSKSLRRDPALLQHPVEDTSIRQRNGSFGSPVPALFLPTFFGIRLNSGGSLQLIEAHGWWDSGLVTGKSEVGSTRVFLNSRQSLVLLRNEPVAGTYAMTG
jgi:hypothetical protein